MTNSQQRKGEAEKEGWREKEEHGKRKGGKDGGKKKEDRKRDMEGRRW